MLKRAANITGMATMWALLMLPCLSSQTAVAADAPSPPSQKAIIDEVVRVANQFIDHGPCEPSRAEPSVVATMAPYTPKVAAGRGVAKYAVMWSGDIGCRNGSGTSAMNILLLEKHGTDAAHVVGVNELRGAASIERIVGATADTLTVEVYTRAPGEIRPEEYERWTVRRERDGQWKKVVTESVDPPPSQPGEKKLPTAMLDY
jgi:hypothetical protein